MCLFSTFDPLWQTWTCTHSRVTTYVHVYSDLQTCLICIACRIPRTQPFNTESFITRQDPTGNSEIQNSFYWWCVMKCLVVIWDTILRHMASFTDIVLWKLQQMLKSGSVYGVYKCVLMCMWCSTQGKIISIETSALRATGRPGWEDLVRKCIYAFFQPQGKEPSHAKKLLHEGM